MTSPARILLLGVISAGLMALSILLQGQIWTPRTDQLVLLWGLGGCLGAALTLVCQSLVSRQGWSRLAAASRFFGFLPAFAIATSPVFLVQQVLNNGWFELNPDRPVLSLVFTSLQIIALFLYTLPPQLFPWLGPAMMLLGWLVLFRLARRDG